MYCIRIMKLLTYMILLLTMFILMSILSLLTLHWFIILCFILFTAVFYTRLFLAARMCYTAYRIYYSSPKQRLAIFRHVGKTMFMNGTMYQTQWYGCSLPKFPVIYMVNYPNETLEYAYPSIFESMGIRMSIMSRRVNNFRFASLYLDPRYNQIDVPEGGDGFQTCMQQIDDHLRCRGHSIWAYPERGGSLKKKYSLVPLRDGLFQIAEQLGNIPIVPIVCTHLSDSLIIRIYVGSVIQGHAIYTKQYVYEHFQKFFSKLHQVK